METLATFLASTEFFGSLGPEALEEVERELKVERLAAGECLFREGDQADSLYIVKSGRLRAIVGRGGPEPREVGEAGRGDVVGELALLSGGLRSAELLAIRDTEVLRLAKAGFERLVEKHPRTMLLLARRIVTRAVEAMHRPARSSLPATIAIFPAGPEVMLPEFARKLEAALSSVGPTILIDSARAAAEPGAADRWEAENRFVIYVCDHRFSAWNKSALRQADRIMIVAESRLPPTLPDEAALAGLLQARGQRELVLVHDQSRPQYPQTQRWLSGWPVCRHHHVVRGAADDFARLARFLTGQTRGLVLGGGGARGLAHIGVIRAIGEAKIDVDLVGGASMGAFMGSQFALGLDWKAMRDFNKHLWTRKPFSDYTLPFFGLVGGRRFLRVARELYGNSRIEDLSLDYFCVVSNLTQATVATPASGPLLRWVGASMAIPGIIAPMFHEGNLYVDGGVLDNVPIDVMRRRCEGNITAVDVTPREDLAVDPKLKSSPSSWKMLGRMLNPFGSPKRLPSLFDILSRTTSLSSIQSVETMKSSADLYLHPPVDNFGLLEFSRIDEIIEAGYRYASALLEKGGSDRAMVK